MNAPTLNSLQRIEAALNRMDECPGFAGAVLATADGLVLATHGSLQGDAVAACAASLALDSKASLATIGHSAPTELMVWTDTQVWYQTRMPSTHLVLAVSSDHGHAGALRLAVRRELTELRDALTSL